MKKCKKCGETNNFYKTISNVCRECFKIDMVIYKRVTNWKKYYQTPKGRFKDYESQSSRRGFVFLIDFNFFNSMIQNNCIYCGVSNVEKTIGIDRVDNNKGYSFDNCVPCCSNCNYSKRGRTDIDFINHCKRVSEFQSTKCTPIMGHS